jgi:hypothetical protein
MTSVRIDSGINPLTVLKFVPRRDWARLVDARRYFIFCEFNRDCRKLVEWVGDAKELWRPLGYASVEDLLGRGYDLNPEEVALVVRWLEINNPAEAIGLEEVKRELMTPQEAGALGGRGNKAADNVRGFSHGNGAAYLRARLKRDHPKIFKDLEAGRYKSARAAGIAAGIVKEKTTLDQLLLLWEKATPAERRKFGELTEGRGKPMTEREAASVGPRELKTPGTVVWAWQTLNALKRSWELKELSVKQYDDVLDELKEYRAWELVPPGNPYGSLEAMLKAEIGD